MKSLFENILKFRLILCLLSSLLLAGCGAHQVNYVSSIEDVSGIDRGIVGLRVLDLRASKRIAYSPFAADIQLKQQPEQTVFDAFARALPLVGIMPQTGNAETNLVVEIREYSVQWPYGWSVPVTAKMRFAVKLVDQDGAVLFNKVFFDQAVETATNSGGMLGSSVQNSMSACLGKVVDSAVQSKGLLAVVERGESMSASAAPSLPPAVSTTRKDQSSKAVSSGSEPGLLKADSVYGRQALVIGNGAYSSSPLRNPTHDANAVANALRRLGFTVIRKNNVSLRQMEQAMDQFYASLGKGSVGLFYYAGHGVQVDGRNYLVPTDASIRSESDTKYECMDAGRILGKMEDAGNAINIVILDACRNNPFAGSYRSASRGLARMDAPTGSIVAYSTAPGKVASDGKGQNGVYTKHLLKYMATPGLDINDIFIRTRMGVIQETEGQQVPWESSSLTGYFYFAGQGEKIKQ